MKDGALVKMSDDIILYQVFENEGHLFLMIYYRLKSGLFAMHHPACKCGDQR